jgi:hypothetical protein
MNSHQSENQNLNSKNSGYHLYSRKRALKIANILLWVSVVCAYFFAPIPIIGIAIALIALVIAIVLKAGRTCIYAVVVIVLCSMSYLFYSFVIMRTVKDREERMKANTAEYNLQVLGKALHNYANAHSGYLPPADKWGDSLLEFDKTLSENNFKHPKIEGSVIAFNKNLGGKNMADIPRNTVLLFEAKGGWNVSGGEELINSTNLNRSYVSILYVNQKIDDYWLKEKGVKSNYTFRDKFFAPRWKP